MQKNSQSADPFSQIVNSRCDRKADREFLFALKLACKFGEQKTEIPDLRLHVHLTLYIMVKKEVVILNNFSDEKDCLVGIDKMLDWLCNHGLKLDDILRISLFARKVEQGDVFDIWLKSINVELLKALSNEKTFVFYVDTFEDSIELNIKLRIF